MDVGRGESLLSLLSLLRAPLGKFREGLERAFPEESVHVRRSALSSISRPWRPFADWHGGAILGGPWGAVFGGAPLTADISVYARLRGMRPNLRSATYWKLWTSVGGKAF